MKESKLIEMRNKVETLGMIVQQMTAELRNLRDLSVGTLETLKRMDGYQDAINKLQEEYVKKEDTDGTATGDSDVVGADQQSDSLLHLPDQPAD